MKIAVTGATGFVGRYVLEALRKRNIDVVAVTRRARMRNDGLNAGPDWITCDISRAHGDCFAALSKPDAVIHLAWGGLPNYRSLHHFEIELPMHYRYLSDLVRGGLKRLVVAGSCLEYGLQSGPLSADTVTSPITPYGFAKDSLRRQLEFLRTSIGQFDFIWARLFYLYGEGQPQTSLFAQLQKAVTRGSPVFKMSAGEQLRDYLPVTEAADQIVECACGSPQSGTVNICSGTPISVRRLVEQWVTERSWNIALEFGDLPYTDYEPMAFWGA